MLAKEREIAEQSTIMALREGVILDAGRQPNLPKRIECPLRNPMKLCTAAAESAAARSERFSAWRGQGQLGRAVFGVARSGGSLERVRQNL